jgi:hypothetical protein
LKSLIFESDATVVVSAGSRTDLLATYEVDPAKVFVVEHGADLLERRGGAMVAADPHPSAVLVGIPQTTDAILLSEVARLLPGVTFHFIGPFGSDFRRLFHGTSNVVFHGELHHKVVAERLPQYGVGLIFYNQSAMARLAPGETGMKFYDYLAAGLPIASVPLPAFQGRAWPVLTGLNAIELATAVSQCLTRRAELSAQALSCANHSGWPDRVNEFETIATRLLGA